MVDPVHSVPATEPLALSRTALRALRLRPAPGQRPVRCVYSRRRGEYIDLFDPVACTPMRPPRPLTDPQRQALELGRRRLTHTGCSACGRDLARSALTREGVCVACHEAQFHAAQRERDAERLATLADLLAAGASPRRTLFLDIETTGLCSEDEALDLAVIDATGQVLLDSLVRPVVRTSWPEAERIHGIRPVDVQQAPTLVQLLPQLHAVLTQADAVVIYNARFDLSFMPAELRSEVKPKALCAMEAFALWRGEWGAYHGNYRSCTLGEAAGIAGHRWTGPAHRALQDALALRRVWAWLQDRVTAAQAIQAHQACQSVTAQDQQNPAEPETAGLA